MVEDRVTRARQADSDEAISRLGEGSAPRAGIAVLKTKTVTTYPTTAQSYYACQVSDVSGAEVEAGAVTLTTAGSTVYAANVGASIPPTGTYVIAHQVAAGRWAFRYG